MRESLESCHAALAELLGPRIESIRVVERCEEHRQYWRPKDTRVVLLAESHVYTPEVELDRAIQISEHLPSDTPRGFVRLVYSLGYGEDGSLDKPMGGSRNSGTPQFWKILLSCVKPCAQQHDFTMMKKAHTKTAERIAAKVKILQDLRARGVWLVNACIAALYFPGGKKPPQSLIGRALVSSWQGYTRSVIEEAAPKAILCIGLGVAHALKDRLDDFGTPWAELPQPNAHLPTNVHLRTFAEYNRVCADPGEIIKIRSRWSDQRVRGSL
jgi:hypothetical protein